MVVGRDEGRPNDRLERRASRAGDCLLGSLTARDGPGMTLTMTVDQLDESTEATKALYVAQEKGRRAQRQVIYRTL
jgi:hypothetical protein